MAGKDTRSRTTWIWFLGKAWKKYCQRAGWRIHKAAGIYKDMSVWTFTTEEVIGILFWWFFVVLLAFHYFNFISRILFLGIYRVVDLILLCAIKVSQVPNIRGRQDISDKFSDKKTFFSVLVEISLLSNLNITRKESAEGRYVPSLFPPSRRFPGSVWQFSHRVQFFYCSKNTLHFSLSSMTFILSSWLNSKKLLQFFILKVYIRSLKSHCVGSNSSSALSCVIVNTLLNLSWPQFYHRYHRKYVRYQPSVRWINGPRA